MHNSSARESDDDDGVGDDFRESCDASADVIVDQKLPMLAMLPARSYETARSQVQRHWRL